MGDAGGSMIRDHFRQARVLITGASAGIGRALAEALAGPDVTLGLVARRPERLQAVAAAARARGAEAVPFVADVTEQTRMLQVVRDFAAQAGGITHAIANAGISGPDNLLSGDPAPLTAMVQTNVEGVLNTLLPAVPIMCGQGRGYLVAISSVAGFRALPGRGTYCASKAAVTALMDGFRPRLRAQGIQVTTICPGFVATELTEKNRYAMPFLMPAGQAARMILYAIARGKRTYVLPWQMRLIVPLLKRMPDALLPQR